MQYATIHIQANPFVSIWFSRFGNCNAALIVDGRYESPQGNPSLASAAAPFAALWCISGRKTHVERGEPALFSDFGPSG